MALIDVRTYEDLVFVNPKTKKLFNSLHELSSKTTILFKAL